MCEPVLVAVARRPRSLAPASTRLSLSSCCLLELADHLNRLTNHVQLPAHLQAPQVSHSLAHHSLEGEDKTDPPSLTAHRFVADVSLECPGALQSAAGVGVLTIAPPHRAAVVDAAVDRVSSSACTPRRDSLRIAG